jgi:SAM-dependent methyltransferase
MAIGSMHIEWLSALALKSKLPQGATVLDLGPQDLWIEREPLRRVAQRHLSPRICDQTLDSIFGDGPKPKADAQLAFYGIFGGGSYRSADLTDPRADYAFDLNFPMPEGVGRYDVVTNFGTTEHVFNIGQSFENIHDLLKVGGVVLHALPGYGYIDHGFYNIHPCAYLDMAKANEYEVVDFSYCDNINTRMARPIEDAPFDFETLPIQLRDMNDTHALGTKAALLFHDNLRSEETRRALEQMIGAPAVAPKRSWFGNSIKPAQMPDAALPIFVVFDLIFVALRRTERSPEKFITPIQGVYAEMQKQNSQKSK